MKTVPKIESRPEHRYVAKRVVVPMSELEDAVPEATAEVAAWLVSKGEEPADRSLVRYRVIDMPKRLEVDVGLPIAHPPAASRGIEHGLLPAGRYATLVFRGIRNGLDANARLIDWIKQQGEAVDSEPTKAGDAFASRVETLLTDPKAEKDQDKWKTEIAIRLRD